MEDNKSSVWFKFFLWSLLIVFVLRFWNNQSSAGQDANLDRAKDISGYKFKEVVSKLEREEVNRKVPADLPYDSQDIVRYTTDLCTYLFSKSSASILAIEYKEYIDDVGSSLVSVPCAQTAGSKLMNLYVDGGEDFDGIKYNLSSENVSSDDAFLTFKGSNNNVDVTKKFHFYKDSYQVDMILSINKKNHDEDSAVLPVYRVVFFAPHAFGVSSNKTGVVVNKEASSEIIKIPAGQDLDSVWKMPYAFGAEDRFFFHGFFSPKKDFAFRRAFANKVSDNISALFLELEVPSKSYSKTLSFYFGPKNRQDLAIASHDFDSLLSFGILSPICKFLLTLLEWLYSMLGNFGFAILILAFVIKLPFVPLSIRGRRKMSEILRFERKHAHEIADINNRYASDFVTKGQKMSEFYAQHNISQSGRFAMFIPQLLQLPIIYSLYRIFEGYICLHNAPFIFWIKDLSSKDPYFVLPVLLGVMMIVHQNMVAGMQDNVAGVAKYSKYFFAVVMVVIFSRLPAGLGLYWCASAAFGLFEELFYKYLGANLENK